MSAKAKAQKPAAAKKPVAVQSEKKKRARLPPVERAAKLGTQLNRKIDALSRNTNRWQGEASAEQSDACKRLAVTLGEIKPRAEELLADLSYLRDSGFAPKGAAPGRRPLQAGACVEIKENRYDAGVHGENNFAVVSVTEKYILIRHATDTKNPPIPVPRAWLNVVGDDDDGGDEGECAPYLPNGDND
jgi:hypothetical protein